MIKMFNRNLVPKVVALIVAVILWFFVMNEQNPAIDTSFTVPLEVRNTADGYVVDRNVESIKLKVRGPRSLFAMATERDFKAYVDLSGATEGKHSIKVQTTLPQGFDLITASPESVIFDIDKIVTKTTRVDIAFSGSPESGVTIGKAIPAYKSVQIEGPSLAVSEVEKVVGYLNLSGKNSDFSSAVPVVAVNKDGKEVSDIKILPDTVNVDVSIVKGLYKKYVDVKANLQNDLPEDKILAGIKIEPAKMDIYGDQRVVDTLEVIYTEPVSLADVDKPMKKQVKLQLPLGITVIKDTITVTIDVSEKKQGG